MNPQTALSPRPDRCAGERAPDPGRAPQAAPGATSAQTLVAAPLTVHPRGCRGATQKRSLEPARAPGAQATAPGPGGGTGAVAPHTPSTCRGAGLGTPPAVGTWEGRRQAAPNDRAGQDPCLVVRAERADGASTAEQEREACSAATHRRPA